MSDLKDRLVKLAYNNPDMRDDLLPLIEKHTDRTAVSDSIPFDQLASLLESSLRSELNQDFQKSGDRTSASYKFQGPGNPTLQVTKRGSQGPSVTVDVSFGHKGEPRTNSEITIQDTSTKKGTERGLQKIVDFVKANI